MPISKPILEVNRLNNALWKNVKKYPQIAKRLEWPLINLHTEVDELENMMRRRLNVKTAS